ncbi:hypothetical protein CTH_2316 [Carboxydocella thermautotrophica]|nr:hypothetical protein CTH_2316 [Carboxydocella thermautotrophica]
MLVRAILVIFITLMTLLNGGCANDNQTSTTNSQPEFRLYAYDMGNVHYVEVFNLDKQQINYKVKLINLRKQGLLASDIYQVQEKKFYCPNYSHKGEIVPGRIVVLNNLGQIIKTINIKDKYGAHDLIVDPEKKLAYVRFILQPAPYNPSGTPFKIINTEQDKVVKPFYLKGSIDGYDISGNFIYVIATAAGLGYNDVPNNYIATIDRNTQELKILTPNGLDFCPTDLKIAPNGKIYLVSSLNNLKYEGCNEPKISIFNTDGKLIKEIKLDLPYCNQILINKNGIAYITHNNGGELGDSITIFDTNTDKVISRIKGFSGPTYMAIRDNYLFVSNYNTGKISVVDLKTNQIIGNIMLGEDVHPSKIIIY